MPVPWDTISPLYPLSEKGVKKAEICDECDFCDNFGKCQASECKCFVINLVDKQGFSCPVNKF